MGLALSVIGMMNIKGNINTIHSYNRRKVKEEDKPKYGKTIGVGTLIVGISVILAFVVSLWNEDLMPYIAAPGIVIGLAIMIFGQFKYNHGFF